MQIQLPIRDFSPEQSQLWKKVQSLWEMSRGRDKDQVRATLHPEYVGWDISTQLPHDREAAVGSVTDDSPILQDYILQPLSVRIYDGRVGVVHYSYAATVLPKDGEAMRVTGKWSEVYLKDRNEWMMISVSGKPDELK
ncbi:nuclear transport factor 2 family protein [Sulfurimonas sp. HSL3-7]|uniref:nuclear transport factor 2 family protein n=1 Tax=Sulfonitrofixus jiaomeiensis TaxID=3131938 RepID=UPI0031F9B16A